jgi:hypothetical protein
MMKAEKLNLGSKKSIASRMMGIMESEIRMRSYRDFDELVSLIAPNYVSILPKRISPLDIVEWEASSEFQDFSGSMRNVLFDIETYKNKEGDFPLNLSGKTLFEIEGSLLKELSVSLGNLHVFNNMSAKSLYISSKVRDIDFSVPYDIIKSRGGSELVMQLDPSLSGSLPSLASALTEIDLSSNDVSGHKIVRHLKQDSYKDLNGLIKKNERKALDNEQVMMMF